MMTPCIHLLDDLDLRKLRRDGPELFKERHDALKFRRSSRNAARRAPPPKKHRERETERQRDRETERGRPRAVAVGQAVQDIGPGAQTGRRPLLNSHATSTPCTTYNHNKKKHGTSPPLSKRRHEVSTRKKQAHLLGSQRTDATTNKNGTGRS